MVAYPKFPSAYNNGGATLNMPDARKPLIFKAFRASLTLVPAGYIATGDAKGSCNLALGQRDGSSQSVAQADDLRLPRGEALPYQLPQPQSTVPVMDVLQHGVVHSNHIHQLQGISLFV